MSRREDAKKSFCSRIRRWRGNVGRDSTATAYTMLLPCLLLLAGLALTIAGVRFRSQATRMQRWATACGVISNSAVREVRGDPNISAGPIYHGDVQYDYTVGGRDFRGNSLRQVSYEASWRVPAERVVAEHPVGREVTVYYDPEDPRQSTLDVAGAPSAARLLIAGGVALAFAASGWIAAIQLW